VEFLAEDAPAEKSVELMAEDADEEAS